MVRDRKPSPEKGSGKKKFPLWEATFYACCLVISILLFSGFPESGGSGSGTGGGKGTGSGTGNGSGVGQGIGKGTGDGSGDGDGSGIGDGKGNGSGNNQAEGEGSSTTSDNGDGTGGTDEGTEPENSPEQASPDEQSAANSPETPAATPPSSAPANGPKSTDTPETDAPGEPEMALEIPDNGAAINKINIGKEVKVVKYKAKTVKPAKIVPQKGKKGGKKGSGGGGGGGGGKKTEIIGGMKVQANRLGVILDVSGSMTNFLPALRKEIDEKYKNASSYYEVVGCSLFSSGEDPLKANKHRLGGAKIDLGGVRGGLGKTKGLKGLGGGGSNAATKINSTLEAMLKLKRSGVDAIYWFCDLQDPEQEEALNQLEQTLTTGKVRLYVKSVGCQPNPRLEEIVKKSGGSFIVGR